MKNYVSNLPLIDRGYDYGDRFTWWTDWNKMLVESASDEIVQEFVDRFDLHLNRSGYDYSFASGWSGFGVDRFIWDPEKRKREGKIKYYFEASASYNRDNFSHMGKGKPLAGYKKGDKILNMNFSVVGNYENFDVWVSFPDYKFFRWSDEGGQYLLATNQSIKNGFMTKEKADLIMNDLKSLINEKINDGFILRPKS